MKISQSVLLEGAARFGLPGAEMRYLGGMDGAVYECWVPGGEVVLKFEPVTPEKLPAIEEKFRFVQYLSQGGVEVAYPIPSREGRLVEVVSEGEQAYAVTHSPKAPGSHVDTRTPLWTPDFIRRWGQTMGQMHRLTRAYPVWRRPVEPGDPPTAIQDWQLEMQDFFGWTQDEDVLAVWRRLRDELGTFPVERAGYGLVHNDLHPWNMLYDGQRLTVIDFDVNAYHWFIIDMGVAIFQGLWQHPPVEDAQRFVQQFLEGYARENDLPQAWLDRLPVALRYRQALLYIVFARTWSEPLDWQKRLMDDLRPRVLRDEPIVRLAH